MLVCTTVVISARSMKTTFVALKLILLLCMLEGLSLSLQLILNLIQHNNSYFCATA